MRKGGSVAHKGDRFEGALTPRIRGAPGNISIGINIEANQCHHPALPPIRAVAFHIASYIKTQVQKRLHDNGSGAGSDRIGTDAHGNDWGHRIGLPGAGFVEEAGDRGPASPRRNRPAADAGLEYADNVPLQCRADHAHHRIGSRIAGILAGRGELGEFFDNAFDFVHSTGIESISLREHADAASSDFFRKMESRPHRPMVHPQQFGLPFI